ncbi:hypothetical protein Q9R19_07770 [Microbacterium sp. ARD32]|uniref:hypothetical protein n=1 Tax=Microbacterium sp. ARD32 TaxID=2962577 RepID=UPI0028816F09|nr:hypothetical protein [Microbacterium sp. ARD32]MDT0157515.1 hypothetical protein [Microbacterium sp. ARD32]
MSTAAAGTGPDDQADSDDSVYDADAVYYEDEVQPEHGILGFTLRELIIVGAWVVAFTVSFFAASPFGASVWTRGIDWILTIGLPTAAVFLVVLRRFSPEGIRRVGSLGIDQFASVAAAVSATAWAQLLWRQVAATLDAGTLLVGWVPIVALVALLVLVAATIFAPLVPGLREDFVGRMETLAHRNANPVRPVIPRPRPEQPVADDEQVDAGQADAGPVDAAVAPVAETSLTVAAEPLPAPPRTAEHAASAEMPVPEQTSGTEQTSGAEQASGTEQASGFEPVPDFEVDDDATRAIDVIPPPPASVVSAPEVSMPEGSTPEGSTPEGSTPEGDAVAAHTAVVDDVPEVDGPAADPEPRDAGTAYTDPIGALHEIFAEHAQQSDAQHSEEQQSDPHRFAAPPPSEGEPPLRRNRSERTPPTYADPQPFWILARTERDVLDEHGHPLFRIGPDAWTLVIEDRGGAYVVRHDDGRIGYLHDLADITKG